MTAPVLFRRLVNALIAFVMAVPSVPHSGDVVGSEQVRSVQRAKSGEEHEEHTHTDVAGQTSHLPPDETAQGQTVRLSGVTRAVTRLLGAKLDLTSFGSERSKVLTLADGSETGEAEVEITPNTTELTEGKFGARTQ